MNKKIVSVFIVVCMFMTLLTGCGSKTVLNDKKDDKQASEKITVTDMLGRKVTLKNGAAKKIIANNPGSLRLYCYVGSVDKLVGVPDREKKDSKRRPYAMANSSIINLPSIGEGRGNNADDFEKILQLKPDVIFANADDKAALDKMQEKIGIPVVALSYGKGVIFDKEMYDSLKLIGKVIGEEKRANEVVNYMEKCKKDLNDRTKNIPDDKKLSAYAGGLAWKGAHGIESTRENYPLFNAVNAKNVVKGINKDGAVMIDKEKLLEWNPDRIFIDLASLRLIKENYRKNPKYYNTLSAFKNGEVYSQLPYVWCYVNIDTAMADAYYIGKVLYPEQFKDIEPEKKADEIYKFLVGKELYSEMAKESGGFKKITLEELEKVDTSKKK